MKDARVCVMEGPAIRPGIRERLTNLLFCSRLNAAVIPIPLKLAGYLPDSMVRVTANCLEKSTICLYHGNLRGDKLMNIIKILFPVLLALLGSGCGGVYTYNETARGGDTVAVPAGWKQSFTKDSITVEIYSPPANPTPLATYGPGDPRIRGVTNAYVDPLSSMVVSRETGQDLTPFAQTYALSTASTFTGADRDWWQTLVFVDLPDPMPQTGAAAVYVYTPTEDIFTIVDIISTTGGHPHSFGAEVLGPVSDNQFKSIGRVPHYTVTFSGTTLPQAIQVDLIHDPDKDNSGVGKAHVVNPLGYVKNLSWNDDGTNLRVIMTPARDAMINDMLDFKFYVAGGVTNLVLQSVQAFDINGNAVIPAIGAAVN